MLKQVTNYTIIETNDIRRINIEFKFNFSNGNDLAGSDFIVGYVYNIKLHCGEEIHGDFDVTEGIVDTYFDVFERNNSKGGFDEFIKIITEFPTLFQNSRSH